MVILHSAGGWGRQKTEVTSLKIDHELLDASKVGGRGGGSSLKVGAKV
jgi:hypothetical protein